MNPELYNPFPGLRPYTEEEEYLFFGRERHVSELIQRMKRNRFVSVLGSSGSGKSSLVYAGLLPELEGGVRTETGSQWRITCMKPGSDPIRNLAKALLDPDFLENEDSDQIDALELDITTATLKRSNLGLIRSIKELIDDQPRENLLILVDQFEELFRFERWHRGERNDESITFVQLLLEASRQTELPIYVIITMRSDFLSECVSFEGLPEMINHGQYLIPRLNRSQLSLVITGPIKVSGASISNPLLQQLLNDIGDNLDQLPILQHALMRTYNKWMERGRETEPIELEDYHLTGGMAEAMSQHAEEVFYQLTETRHPLVESLFKCLTYKEGDGRGIRRPCKLAQLCAITNTPLEDVIEVIECFRKPGQAFLTPPHDTELELDSLIDISHESIMRIWWRLKDWVDGEARASNYFKRIVHAAELYYAGEAELMHGLQLELSLQWLLENQPTAAWAEQYKLPYDNVMEFIKLSKESRDAEIRRKEEARRREQAQSIERAKAEIRVLSRSSQHLFSAGNPLDALLEALEAGNKFNSLKNENKEAVLGDESLLTQIETSLYMALAGANEKNRWPGHNQWPNSMSISPDGNLIVSGGYGKLVKRWYLNGLELQALKGHTGAIFALDVNGDYDIISGDEKGHILLWNKKGELVKNLRPHGEKAVNSLVFNREGTAFLSGGADGNINLFSKRGILLATWSGSRNPIQHICFHPVLNYMISGDEKGNITVWEMNTEIDFSASAVAALEKREKKRPMNLFFKVLTSEAGHQGKVTSLDCHPEKPFFASSGADDRILLWDLITGSILDSMQCSMALIVLRFNPDGSRITIGTALGSIQHWNIDIQKGKLGEKTEFSAHKGMVSVLDYSKTSNRLVSAGYDLWVKVWQTENQFQTLLIGHSAPVMGIDISPDGKTIASCGADRAAKLWNLEGELLNDIKGDWEMILREIRFSPNGLYIASACHDGNALLWRVKDIETVMVLGEGGIAVNDVDFSSDSSFLMVAGLAGNVTVWDIAKQSVYRNYDVGKEEIETWGIRSGPDNQYLTLAVDCNARLRKLDDNTCLKIFKSHTKGVLRGAFSPDGRFIATAALDKSVLWDINGNCLFEFPGSDWGMNALNFSPDSSLLATAGRNGDVRLWRTDNGRLYKNLLGHTQQVNQVVFSPDGKRVISASSDNTGRIWDKWDLGLDELLGIANIFVKDFLDLKEKLHHPDLSN